MAAVSLKILARLIVHLSFPEEVKTTSQAARKRATQDPSRQVEVIIEPADSLTVIVAVIA